MTLCQAAQAALLLPRTQLSSRNSLRPIAASSSLTGHGQPAPQHTVRASRLHQLPVVLCCISTTMHFSPETFQQSTAGLCTNSSSVPIYVPGRDAVARSGCCRPRLSEATRVPKHIGPTHVYALAGRWLGRAWMRFEPGQVHHCLPSLHEETAILGVHWNGWTYLSCSLMQPFVQSEDCCLR